MTPLPQGCGLDEQLVAGIVAIAVDEQAHEALGAAGRSCRFCAEPVRLTGTSASVDQAIGEILESFSSKDLARGELYRVTPMRR